MKQYNPGLCYYSNSVFTAVSSGKLHTADVGEEEAKKTQQLGIEWRSEVC